MDYQVSMNRCKTLAKQAEENGEAGVGAVVLFNGEIISEAMEATVSTGDISRHAEMEALRKAHIVLGKDLSGCILVTTHEPCVMCSYSIRYHRISKVVYGTASDYLGGVNSSFSLLTSDDVPKHWGPAPEILQLK